MSALSCLAEVSGVSSHFCSVAKQKAALSLIKFNSTQRQNYLYVRLKKQNGEIDTNHKCISACFFLQVKEVKIGDVERTKMSLRRGSWCSRRMDRVSVGSVYSVCGLEELPSPPS